MRVWRAFSISICFGIATSILLPSSSVASPLFPDIRASRSANGEFLVVVEERFDNPGPVRRILRSTYLILRCEPFMNSRDRLQTAASFWSDFGWQVTLKGEDSQRVFLPLISNDGNTLVLIAAGVAMKHGDQEALRMYTRQGNVAKLVHALRLSEVWTHEDIESHAVFGEMGETPMWYAGGSLDFSADGRELIYHSRWNHQARIKLADGSTVIDHK
jgi:hypothetical protein